MTELKPFGKIALIDLYWCEHSLMDNEKKLAKFLKALTNKIDMQRFGPPIIRRLGAGELEGVSGFNDGLINKKGFQFIQTSNITVHLDEVNDRAFIDIFSCEEFNIEKAELFSRNFYKAKKSITITAYRGGGDLRWEE